MKKVSIILVIIAYISLIVRGFMYGISEGLLRLAFCSLCFAILPPLFSMDDDNKKKNKLKWQRLTKYM